MSKPVEGEIVDADVSAQHAAAGAEQSVLAAAEAHDILREVVRNRVAAQRAEENALIFAGIAIVGAYVTYRLFVQIRDYMEKNAS